MTSRRNFLAGLLAAGLCPRSSWADAGSPAYLAAARRPDGAYALCGLSDGGAAVFELPLPGRGHAAAAHPARPEAVAFARRPGTFALVIDCAAGRQVAALTAPRGRHFYGHGAFSPDGSLLFTTENDYEAAQGVIGVWDAARAYRRVAEFPSGGVGPHELRLMGDGATLVIANGGIETHPDSGRTKLNLATMRPNLSYVTLDGRLLDQVEPPAEWRRNSIRHLALGEDGLVAAALQWEGDGSEHPPLLALHRRGGALAHLAAPREAHRQMQGYAGSIAICRKTNEVAITSPRGGAVQVFDLAGGRFLRMFRHPDLCGVSEAPAGFVVTAGTGSIRGLSGADIVWTAEHRSRWDNHLVKVG